MKKYLIKGSRVISGTKFPNFRYYNDNKIIEASSWSSAVNKAGKLGWGGKTGFYVSEIKTTKRRKNTKTMGDSHGIKLPKFNL